MAGSIAKRPDGRWRARYRDDSGRERSRHFVRKVDAAAWLDEITAILHTGTYVNPRAGRVTFQEFYDGWAPRQLWVPSTRANADLAVRSVGFGNVPLKAIDPALPRRDVGEVGFDPVGADDHQDAVRDREVGLPGRGGRSHHRRRPDRRRHPASASES